MAAAEVKKKVVPVVRGGGMISCRRNEIIHEATGRNVEMVPERKKINHFLLVTWSCGPGANASVLASV